MKPKISAVVSAFNEERNIESCLESLAWADEIILVDNTSLDKTVALAKKYTNKIFIRENNKMLNINKNFGFDKATGDWIINLDADERVTEELKKEILAKINQKNNFIAWQLPRKNIIFGQWIQHGIWWPDYQTRVFKKGQAKFSCKHIHEKLVVNGEFGTLENSLIHYNYYSIAQFVTKMNDYTQNEADNFLVSGKKIYWHDAIRMPANDFLANFFARESYKDGLHGLVLSLLQAFYALLVFAKVWEKQKFWEYNSNNFVKEVNLQFKKSYQDCRYWSKRSGIKSFLKKIIKRK